MVPTCHHGGTGQDRPCTAQWNRGCGAGAIQSLPNSQKAARFFSWACDQPDSIPAQATEMWHHDSQDCTCGNDCLGRSAACAQHLHARFGCQRVRCGNGACHTFSFCECDCSDARTMRTTSSRRAVRNSEPPRSRPMTTCIVKRLAIWMVHNPRMDKYSAPASGRC